MRLSLAMKPAHVATHCQGSAPRSQSMHKTTTQESMIGWLWLPQCVFKNSTSTFFAFPPVYFSQTLSVSHRNRKQQNIYLFRAQHFFFFFNLLSVPFNFCKKIYQKIPNTSFYVPLLDLVGDLKKPTAVHTRTVKEFVVLIY